MNIVELIQFGRPSDLVLCSVELRYRPGTAMGWFDVATQSITLVLDPKLEFPIYFKPDRGKGGYLPATINSYEELVVRISAHEFRHAWQFMHGKELSEHDADLYAHRMLEAYRMISCT